MAAELEAGTSALALPIALGQPLMGYAVRTAPAAAVHDPLHARALYLRGRSDCLIVSLEVCLLAPSHADLVRDRARAEDGRGAGADPRGLHPHARGPRHRDRGARGRAARRPRARLRCSTPRCAQARRRSGARGAGAPRARARRGAHRREPAPGRRPLRPRGCSCCASTTRRARRWPWSTATAATRPRSAPRTSPSPPTGPGPRAPRSPRRCRARNPIFLLGAHADVDPRTRGVKDLAETGKTSGVGFDAVRAARARGGRRGGARGARRRAVARRGGRRRAVGARAPPGAPRGRGRAQDGARRARPAARHRARHERALPARDASARGPCRPRSAASASRACARYLRGRTGASLRGWRRGRRRGAGAPDRRRALRGAARSRPPWTSGWTGRRAAAPAHAALLSIANGWLRYLPHARNFREPDAHTALRGPAVDLRSRRRDAPARRAPSASTRRLDAELGA